MQNTLFLTMFPCCAGFAESISGLAGAAVLSCNVSEKERNIKVIVRFSALPVKAEICTLENRIREYYCLSSCSISAADEENSSVRDLSVRKASAEDIPAELPSVPHGNADSGKTDQIGKEPVPKSVPIPATLPIPPEIRQESAAPKPSGNGTVLMGRPVKQNIIPMKDITVESGRVAVEGDVLAVESRLLQKRGSAVLCFDITDKTNSFRVSKFLRNTDDQSII